MGICILEGSIIETSSAHQYLELGCVLISRHSRCHLQIMELSTGCSGAIRISESFLNTSGEVLKGLYSRFPVNHSLSLVVSPGLRRATSHEGQCIQNLCALIWKGSWLDSDGEPDSLNETLCLCTVSTKLLWICHFYRVI